MNWRSNAACAGAAPGLFHPQPPPKGDPRQALSYCRRCPVLGDCARHALAVRSVRGIAAGVWPVGDDGWDAALRAIATGYPTRARCLRCWRLLPPESAKRTCQLCGFAEIPV
ncbi:WhiB family transcriptional regulator [Nocardia concava]|uniref:WhiB family transcriptional regulator n=1 Tax=Nocardia concava TaxID=257281 RepID=UPI0002E58CD3|nr:WhiB family transcriptional regulator [Nocardia concava]